MSQMGRVSSDQHERAEQYYREGSRLRRMRLSFRVNLVRRAGKAARRLVHARRLRRDDVCSLGGVDLLVPQGLPHPLVHGAARFFLRTTGPMIAPGQRVLVLDCGPGLDVVGAASRGALVVGRDLDPRAVESTRANLDQAGLAGEVEVGRDLRGGPWDLVLWNPDGVQDLDAVLSGLPAALGERGRFLLGTLAGSSARSRAQRALSDAYRIVPLARSPGLLAPYEVLSVGLDLEASRARRHAERGRSAQDKAGVSRRRWERGETDASAEELARVMEQAP